MLLYCLPDAGSGAGAFAAWPDRLPAHVDVRPLRLPGRERRITEPLELLPDAIAAAVAGHADRPYALYGHSMGARLAFDVVQRLLDTPGVPPPAALYVGGSLPPDRRPPLVDAAEWPDERLVDGLIELTGAGPELRAEPELRALILPIVRADLRWLGTRPAAIGRALPMPVVAFAGAGDRSDGPLPMLGWARAAAGAFRLHTVPGGHAFHRAGPAALFDTLEAELGAALHAAAPAVARPADDEVHVFLADRAWPAGPGLRTSTATAGDLVLTAVTGGADVGAGLHDEAPEAGDAAARAAVRAAAGTASPAGLAVTRFPIAGLTAAVAVRRAAWRLRFERLTT
ncbi:thioesterase II family protein [Dactylosporangium sp. NPDC051541]|uniref:thioesterase II family protein n=1 Tax=Dactylosporangium sp. NPDC051541 TaxID=3363977 RepID=UPI0037B38E11